MTPEAFALLVASCRLDLPAGVTVDRLSAYAETESERDPAKVSPPNRDGSRDWGLMQINEQHFARFGVDRRSVMQPCVNVRIGALILADADRAVACIYNTGRARCSNGYDLKIQRAASRLVASADPPAASAPQPPKPPEEPACAPSFDSWALALCRERRERAKRRPQQIPPPPKTEPSEYP